MKLDRNTNPDGTGKYALVNMRKLIPIADANPEREQSETLRAFDLLLSQGIITLGNEPPGDQFFVMKYKDKFTAPALFAYARAAMDESQRLALTLLDPPSVGENREATIADCRKLQKYSSEIHGEALFAQRLGNRIPD